METLPFWTKRLLTAICPNDLYEQIEGDLIEIYQYDLKTVGKRKAKWNLTFAALRFLRPGILLRNKFSFHQYNIVMFQHFFKIFFRASLKNSSHTLINVGGLVIGMTVCLMISLYVMHERSYDTFHEKKDRLFRVRQDRYTGEELTRQWTAGPWGIGRDLKNTFPEVAEYVSVNNGGNRSLVLSNGEVFFEEGKVLYASEKFFTMFSYPLLKGIDSLVLKKPFTMVVSQSLAKRYFGDQDPIGKTLKCNGTDTYEITGIFKDVPENTHLKFDALLSYESLLRIIGPADTEELMSNWGWSGNYTYIELAPFVNHQTFEAKLPAFVERKAGEVLRSWGERMEFVLQPISSIHLDSNFKDELEANGDRSAVNFLTIIALFVLIIAWINYINLLTAKATERAKEVGVRKVLGSDQMQLIRQFLFESAVTMLVALVITIFVLFLLLPHFSVFTGRKLEIPELSDTWPYLVCAFGLAVVASGLYPSFVMSSFRPINMLKGRLSNSNSGSNLRKALVCFQFISSVVMIAGIIVVYSQLEFMRMSSLGVNTEQLMIIKGPSIKDSTYQSQFSTFRKSILEYPEMKSIAVSTEVPGQTVRASNGGVRLIGQDVSAGNSFRVIQADEEFTETLGMNVIAGRTFSIQRTDHWKVALVNETAMKLLGFTEPEKILGQKINLWNSTLEIVGVIKDFHQESLKKKVDQLIFVCDKEVSDYYSVKLNTTQSIGDAIKKVEARYKTAFPGNPFHYFFLDDHFNQQYQSDVLFGKIFGVFALLAVIIACSGLFGLSSYMVVKRTKEIGIRKVLGASVRQVAMLVSKEFALIVLLANIIAWPIFYFVISKWLDGFAFRINVGVSNFLVPTIISFVIAMLTIATQSIRAAMADPVKNLKAE